MPVPVPEYTSSLRRMSTIPIPTQDIRLDSYHDLYATSASSSLLPNPFESHELEAAFCRDFICCDLIHPDLHALLQHYEESHVDDYEDIDVDIDVVDPLLAMVDNDMVLLESNPMMMGPAAAAAAAVASIHKSAYVETTHTVPCDPVLQKKRASEYVYNEHVKVDNSNDNPTALATSSTRKRPPSALGLLTQSAAKRLEVFDEDLLVQASALLASAAATHSFDSNADKPYKCHVSGCQKAYKNPNGLKYHHQHGHCDLAMDASENIASKPYQCTLGDCGKRYKNLNGLKYHIEHAHMAALSHSLAVLNASFFTNTAEAPTPPLSPSDASEGGSVL